MPWDHILVFGGDYNEDVTINGKSHIKLYPRGSDRVSIEGKISIGNNSVDIEVKDIVVDQIGIYGGSNINIKECFIKDPYNTPLEVISYNGEITAIVKDCFINNDGTRINKGTSVSSWDNFYIELHLENNTYYNCEYGVLAEWNTVDNVWIDIYVSSNTFAACDEEWYSNSPYVNWYRSDCPICPTYFNTPNYPSNYNNNDTVSAALKPPASGGYNVVVNGETECGNDYLYVREMDGTLIEQLSGSQNNYSIWIDSNRPVKVEFVSNNTVTYEGYKVTVESPWTTGVSYIVGDIVLFEDGLWVNTYAHTSQVDWYPGAPGLWFWELME